MTEPHSYISSLSRCSLQASILVWRDGAMRTAAGLRVLPACPMCCPREIEFLLLICILNALCAGLQGSGCVSVPKQSVEQIQERCVLDGCRRCLNTFLKNTQFLTRVHTSATVTCCLTRAPSVQSQRATHAPDPPDLHPAKHSTTALFRHMQHL
jgi:hypothetical protein